MIYLIGIGIMVLQALCAMHAFNSGRQNWILWIVIGGPLGVCAYFAFFLLPEWYQPKASKALVKKARNPALRLQQAEAALAVVETAASHSELADAMFDMRAWDGAVDHYRRALDCLHGPDVKIEKRLAEALFESGHEEEALTIVERQPVPLNIGEADRLTLLRARILEHLGQNDEALDLYHDIATRLPGPEARCRLAAMLLKQGDSDGALTALEDVTRGLTKANMAKSGPDAEMQQWALRQVADLRG